MKVVVFLFLLMTALGMAGAAQAVPAPGSPVPDFEGYQRFSGGGIGIPWGAAFSGRPEGGTGETSSSYLEAYSDTLVQCFALPNPGTLGGGNCLKIWTSLNPEEAWIRFQMGDLAVGEGGPEPPIFSDAGVHGYYLESIELQGERAGAAANEGYPTGVPEPDTMMLLGSGLLVLAGIGRRFTRT